ncbi:MAG: glycosyltransferase family 4 protein [Pelatocladus maniniholoensis HA4357-MV3]|jgi:glycosyltransferase involved in cell wall biosynthesis|uniref:Glycosyltransferase family 4 protein n=1 Tax=Pelatocladus maniniholoensis HA4357-MV3 TaxID=1117104 RepID=A0A9E3LUS4_9NOST|nr:glycosyltransferase family 4 protein [Pelatocladus maniniholoensis HA4357-MV3]BAZ68722.1 group 1 glycosyl transferase [Fischerella sp. NIES-4106]
MKEKLKISILVWNLSTNDGYIRASLLQKALLKLGFEVEILGFLFGKELYAAIPDDTKIYIIEGKKYPDFFKSIGQILKHIDGDIIYAIKPQPASFGVALLKKLYTRRSVIVDIDDWEMSWYGGDDWRYRPTFKQLARDLIKSNGALRSPYHPLYLKWMEGLINQADAVTVHNQFLQQRFGGIFVPNGKDTCLFDPSGYDSNASRIRYGLSGYKILMFPGAPRPYKGLEDILIALEKINQPDLKLVIVGGSPYDDYDRQLQEEWGNWIIKLPKFSADLMPDVVAAAHIVVVPQRDTPETRAQFPLKLTDGMAMAKPVLSTKVGDIPDILGGTGYLAEPDSPEEIAKQIQLIFKDLDAANECGKRARERCVEKYSLEAMASSLKSVIDRL